MLLEQISKEDMKKYIKEYYNYAKTYLDINKAPKIKFMNDQKNADNFLGNTGYYNPKTMTIHLFITDRHPKDIVRSFAHELIHHYQNLNEKLPEKILHKTQEVDYASKDKHLRDMEREAFEKGNMMFRDWTDSLKVKNLQENKMAKKEKLNIDKEAADIDGKEGLSGWELARAKAIANSKKKGKNKMKNKTQERKLEEQESIESVDPRFSKMFEEEVRVMNDYKTKREEIIFNELMKRFLK